jgi:hypothetical protein
MVRQKTIGAAFNRRVKISRGFAPEPECSANEGVFGRLGKAIA